MTEHTDKQPTGKSGTHHKSDSTAESVDRIHPEQLSQDTAHRSNPDRLHAKQVLSWQARYGNQATQRMIDPSAQPAPATLPNIPKLPVKQATRTQIQRGEAGVHRDIEMSAWGTEAPELGEGVQGEEQQNAMEIYVGNWMRDFSQVFVPTVMNTVSEIPQRPGTTGGGSIGMEGGEALVTGLLQALASLEFGPQITQTLVTGGPEGNIGTYRPQEHMDNPAGMAAEGDTLTRDQQGVLGPTEDAGSEQLAGSSGLGSQLENPLLYQISGEGLQNHIYNTIEGVKGNFSTAYENGATAEGRMHFGTGLHGVEDYFAHSNFIEVALNQVLGQNPGLLPIETEASDQTLPSGEAAPVDTMFDASVPDAGGGERQAITTGTFGPDDTKISIAHALLPQLPRLFSSIDGAIDQALLALEQDGSTWADIRETLTSNPAGMALVFILDGMNQAGMELLVSVLDTYTIPTLPGILPDAISQNLEGKIIPIGYSEEWMRPSSAIPAYKTFYDQIKGIWEYRETLRTMLRGLLLIDRVLNAELVVKLREAIAMLNQTVREMVDNFRQTIKQKVREKMFDMIESLTGIDVPAEKREYLEDWLHGIHEGVHEMTHSTSLENRLQPGGDLSGLSEEERANRIPQGALPPSHSEISKDHPTHPSDEEHSVHGPEEGSPFFELHRQLAIDAVRHLGMLMEQAWGSEDPNAALISGQGRQYTDEGSATRNAEAGRAAERAEALANEEERSFAQRDQDIPDAMRPLINAADLYISHPQDNTWWTSIVETYVRENPEQIANDIDRRNAARGDRARPAGGPLRWRNGRLIRPWQRQPRP